MSFVETPRFPDKISYGSSGGPMYNTDVITVTSGYETRNQNWVQSRHSYDAQFGVTTNPLLSELISYFHAMAGKTHGFRYKDWGDYLSCDLNSIPAQYDQEIGTGDSTDGTDGIDTFQIVKNYVSGLTTVRNISKPISGTVLVEVNGVLQTEGTNYDIEYTTGEITFKPTFVPLAGFVIKCGYEFDTPCRFDTDQLNINFDAYGVGNTSVPIIEIRI